MSMSLIEDAAAGSAERAFLREGEDARDNQNEVNRGWKRSAMGVRAPDHCLHREL
jgi:hypothetical protein